VTGRTVPNGGAGDSSVLTAFGVFQGMRAAAEHRWGSPSLDGRLVGVEGVGKVGRRLVTLLAEAGASAVVCDVDPAAVTRVVAAHPGVEVAASRADLLAREIDVYAPCALGGALDDDTVMGLRAGIVCGGANNQLAHPGIEKLLADRGILYAPDYLVNAGGVIQVSDELGGFNFERAQGRAGQIFGTTRSLPSPTPRECRPRSRPTAWPSAGCPRWAGCGGSGWVGEASTQAARGRLPDRPPGRK
jgi:valine dehydrogenase (NAD+)